MDQHLDSKPLRVFVETDRGENEVDLTKVSPATFFRNDLIRLRLQSLSSVARLIVPPRVSVPSLTAFSLAAPLSRALMHLGRCCAAQIPLVAVSLQPQSGDAPAVTHKNIVGSARRAGIHHLKTDLRLYQRPS